MHTFNRLTLLLSSPCHLGFDLSQSDPVALMESEWENHI